MKTEKKQEGKKVSKESKNLAGATNNHVAGEREVSTRGRIFEGNVTKKFPRRVVIEFERPIYVRKYERYLKLKTKLHARLPIELEDKVVIGDYIQIRECRPLSKIIHFIVTKKIRSASEEHKNQSEEHKNKMKTEKMEKEK
ncbi:MAG: 30S ribosomal protein S17 [Nanoarchaeota archaeon]|mgnify:CR=1 FL=1